MSANTTPDNITYPVSTDSIAPLETVFANLASSVQTALNYRQIRSYKWANASALAAQAGMSQGDIGYQTDIGQPFTYNGSGWAPTGAARAIPTLVLFGSVPTALSAIREYNGLVSVNTNGSGDASISYPSGFFPNGIISARLQRVDFSTYIVTSEVLNATQSLTALSFRIYAGGSGLASVSNVRYTYSVIGW